MRVGCGSVDTLERDVYKVTRLPPTLFAERLAEREMIELLVRACRADAGAVRSATYVPSSRGA